MRFEGLILNKIKDQYTGKQLPLTYGWVVFINKTEEEKKRQNETF